VASYPRRRVEMLAEADPQLSREIHQVMFEALSRLQAQLMILGRITATEKVSSFLLTMAERLSDQTLNRVDLPISRYDIADYLGLSVETVSRSLTSLKNLGLIALSGPRSVRIIDRDALEEGPLQRHDSRLRAAERHQRRSEHPGRSQADERRYPRSLETVIRWERLENRNRL
jgi:DNA-binding transcriptional ArsR family regulator